VKESEIPLILPEFTHPPDAVAVDLEKMVEMLSSQ
jgi:hypothetical protein